MKMCVTFHGQTARNGKWFLHGYDPLPFESLSNSPMCRNNMVLRAWLRRMPARVESKDASVNDVAKQPADAKGGVLCDGCAGIMLRY